MLTGWVMQGDKTVRMKCLNTIPIGHKIALAPMKKGASRPPGLPLLRRSVKAKTQKASKAVPRTSAKTAAPVPTVSMPSLAAAACNLTVGFG